MLNNAGIMPVAPIEMPQNGHLVSKSDFYDTVNLDAF